jgi:hypothetical protein
MAVRAPVVPLDPAPRRPDRPLAGPRGRLCVEATIDVAHLANPTVAVSRLLMSEAGAHAHVDGDDTRLLISVALPEDSGASRIEAEAWVRWALHNAGVRGQVGVVNRAETESTPRA